MTAVSLCGVCMFPPLPEWASYRVLSLPSTFQTHAGFLVTLIGDRRCKCHRECLSVCGWTGASSCGDL